jgi:hypothetical protein
MGDLLGQVLGVLFELLGEEFRRFYACSLLALAIAGLILAFVPARTLSIVLSITVLATGIVGGVWWERASR